MTNETLMSSRNPSARLHAVMAAGAAPDPALAATLVEQCATEPDFYVREMLTWALTRFPPATVVPPLVAELRSERAQARSQALHTLSKIGDGQAWPAITEALLTDPDDEVARAAWRAAVVLAPADARSELAAALVTQLGRGGREIQLSLSRSLVALGEAATPALRAAMTDQDPGVRHHAIAVDHLLRNPDAGFAFAIDEATRTVALGPENGGHADR
jgi:HEAT repeat protein